MVFTSSRHLVVGTTGLTAFLVYRIIDQLEAKYFDEKYATRTQVNETLSDTVSEAELRTNVKLTLAISLTFWSGVTQVRPIS